MILENYFKAGRKEALLRLVKLLSKTLATLKLTYVFMNLPDPCDKFLSDMNSLLYKFVWNGKHDQNKNN